MNADHIYERTCPIYNNTCVDFDEEGTAQGPVHVVIGNAGYELSWFAKCVPNHLHALADNNAMLRDSLL